MSNYDKLQKVLQELFQLNQAKDLDFGIYRIINQKRELITDFLENKLRRDIQTILKESQGNDAARLQKELKEAEEDAYNLGMSPQAVPKVVQLKKDLAKFASTDELEQEVYSHLTNFFRRYYKDGDFISQRRYKQDVYAIPYEGEEVKLHWANKDQYFVKTSEFLKDYNFVYKGKKIIFKLRDVMVEHDNNKEEKNKIRLFALYENCPFEVYDDCTLILNFTYELYSKNIKQKKLVEEAILYIRENIPKQFFDILDKHPSSEKQKVIEKHLVDFTSRNNFDFFIHKNLGPFLQQELDFYLKSEVFCLDDLNNDEVVLNCNLLLKIKAIKNIGSKIISFLAQIEGFQKRIWNKKKIVTEANYCISLKLLPSFMFPEILSNSEQQKEWKELYGLDLNSTEDLMEYQNLVIDTKFFSEDFKLSILKRIDSLDNKLSGLLVNSENYQGLRLLETKYKNKIQTIYIDPPFNLDDSKDFLYKVNYKDSSWLSLLLDRVILGRNMLKSDGAFFLRCDVNGNYIARGLLNDIFPFFKNEIILKKANQQGAVLSRFNPATESLFFYTLNSKNKFNSLFKEREIKTKWINMHSPKENTHSHTVEIFNNIYIAPKGRHWTFSQKRVNDLILQKRVRIDEQASYIDVYGNKQIGVPQYRTSNEEIIDSNWSDIPGYSSTTGFSTENSELMLKRVISCSTFDCDDIVLDFFLGSGTTCSTAAKLNRKWIGIEMGNYFSEYPLNRMKKVYSGVQSGISKQITFNAGGMFKYIKLESYEDALNNLELDTVGLFGKEDKVGEEYMLNYMLDIESQSHLFNVDIFKHPFNYQMKITENNELKLTKVDLVETFNYLIGLKVHSILPFDQLRIIEGENPEGEKVLVIWRDLEAISGKELNDRLKSLSINVNDGEYDLIYVNGDHHLDNFRKDESRWKVQLIEETFFKNMFDLNTL